MLKWLMKYNRTWQYPTIDLAVIKVEVRLFALQAAVKLREGSNSGAESHNWFHAKSMIVSTPVHTQAA